MQGIAIVIFLVGQYALGDGRLLDRPLRVGDTVNISRDPLAAYRNQSPLDNRVGMPRLTDRYLQGGTISIVGI